MVSERVTVKPSISVLKASWVLSTKRLGWVSGLMLLIEAEPLPTVMGTFCPLIHTPITSLKLELTYSGYSSEEKTKRIVITLPVGMKFTSSQTASKVFVPARVLNWLLLFVLPLVSVEVPALRFGSPLDWVKLRTSPVERMTP